MTTSYAFHTLDVFTDTIFGGNPLAVLTDARGLDSEQMARLTREFNLSETVFVLPPEDPKYARSVRIFTPGRELPFAGHPTVGTAFLLAALGMIPLTDGDTKIVLGEGVGPVPVTIRIENGAPVSAELTAAQAPEFRDDVPGAAELASLLSISIVDLAGGDFHPRAVSCGVPFLLVPLASRDAVARAKMDNAVWERLLSNAWASEVYLFDASAAQTGAPIRARMYAPALGIGEDPATGSAAACLAAYLASHTSGPVEGRWTVEQGFEMGRRSVLQIAATRTDGRTGNVRVGGRAVLVTQGTIRVGN